jgi:predicted metal-dependent peptidase
MQVTNQKARRAVVKARTSLLIDAPFFGCLALHLDLVEINDPNDVNTMAVDGVNMYYHPPFVLSLSEEELKAVVAHEVLHVAYKHMTRRGHREPEPWNYAGDYVINADLKKVHPPFKLPVPHLYDAKYDGMGTEEVYERLQQELSKRPKMIIQLCNGKGKGSKDGKGSDPTGCGSVREPKAKNGDKPVNAEELAREWEINVRMAVGVAKNHNAGSIPGYLERLVKQLNKPKVNWKDYLRQFIDGSMSKEFSWARPNRRSVALGVLLPGMIADSLHHLVGLIDVSGSISHELARSLVSEMAGALDDGVCDKLTLAYFDTEVRHVDEFIRGDLVEAKVVAGGGTDYKDPLKWLSEIPDASAAVMLTDMMPMSWALEDPGVPYFWGAFCPESFLASVRPQVRFGEIVHVDSAW